jgi:hypothetical protein
MLAAAMLLSFVGCGLFDGGHKKKSHKDEEEDEEEETTIEETEASKETTQSEPSVRVTPDQTSASTYADVENPNPNYEMVMELDTDNNTVTGSMILTFTNTSAVDLNEIYLRDYPAAFQDKNGTYEMDISGVQDLRSGTDVECERDGDDMTTVIIPLDEPLASGEEISLYMDFVTTLPTIGDRFGYYEGVYSLTDFYPILCRFDMDGNWSHEPYFFGGECFYTDMSDYEVELTVPEGYMVGTGGQIISEETDGGYTSYEITAEDIRDFTAIASDEFVEIEAEQNGVQYYLYYVPNDDLDAEAAEAYMDVCINSIEYFSECFGDYPYPTLTCVFSTMPSSVGGMEYSGLVLISNSMYFEKGDDFYGYSADCVIAHEVGHQWFMGIVGSNSYLEPWLDESFASYTEWVYCKEYYPSQASDGIWWLGYDMSTSISDYDNITPGSAYINLPVNAMDDYMYWYKIYAEGAHFLFLLEQELGEDVMYDFIKEYVSRYKFKNATTEDFVNTLYDVVGTDNTEVNKIVNVFLDVD